eukprot:2684593-Heterocapsa_arctica.AAC.1
MEGGGWKCTRCAKFSTTYPGWRRLDAVEGGFPQTEVAPENGKESQSRGSHGQSHGQASLRAGKAQVAFAKSADHALRDPRIWEALARDRRYKELADTGELGRSS